MAPGVHLRMKSSWKILKATPLFLLLLSQSLASVPFEDQPGASYSDSHSCVGCVVVVSVIEQLAEVHNSSVQVAMKRLCSYLPEKLFLKTTCYFLVQMFGPDIIKLTPDPIHKTLHELVLMVLPNPSLAISQHTPRQFSCTTGRLCLKTVTVVPCVSYILNLHPYTLPYFFGAHIQVTSSESFPDPFQANMDITVLLHTSKLAHTHSHSFPYAHNSMLCKPLQ